MAMQTLTYLDGNGVARTASVHPDTAGNLINTISRDSSVATYSAGGSIAVANMAASLTELLLITGHATKTVRVQRLHLDGVATTGEDRPVLIRKHTVANTGGTAATAPDKVPFDSGDAAAGATVTVYTANPTVDSTKKTALAFALPFTADTTAAGSVDIDFVEKFGHAMVLRGVAQEMAVDFGGTTPGAAAVLNWHIVWTEETE